MSTVLYLWDKIPLIDLKSPAECRQSGGEPGVWRGQGLGTWAQCQHPLHASLLFTLALLSFSTPEPARPAPHASIHSSRSRPPDPTHLAPLPRILTRRFFPCVYTGSLTPFRGAPTNSAGLQASSREQPSLSVLWSRIKAVLSGPVGSRLRVLRILCSGAQGRAGPDRGKGEGNAQLGPTEAGHAACKVPDSIEKGELHAHFLEKF